MSRTSTSTSSVSNVASANNRWLKADSFAKTASIIARGTIRIVSAPNALIVDDSSKGKWSPLWGRRTTAAASLAPVAGHCRFIIFFISFFIILKNRNFLLVCVETHKKNQKKKKTNTTSVECAIGVFDWTQHTFIFVYYYFVIVADAPPQLAVFFLLFSLAVKRKWSTVPNCLSATSSNRKSPTVLFFIFCI